MKTMCRGIRFVLGLAAAAAFSALSAVAPVPAQAAVITFSGLPSSCGPGGTYTENGITAAGIGGVLSNFSGPGVHLDPAGTPCASGVSLTTGGAFNANSALIRPTLMSSGATIYCSSSDSDDCFGPGFVGDPYENVLWQGYRAGSLVASDKLFMGDADSTYVFGDTFRNIDELKAFALNPDFALLGGLCGDQPCAHFNIANVDLSVVPLPAAGWLFVSALAGLGVFRKRRAAAVTA